MKLIHLSQIFLLFVIITQTLADNAPKQKDIVAGNMIMINNNAGWCWYQGEKIIYDPITNSIITSSSANHMGIDGAARAGDVDAVGFYIAGGKRIRAIMCNRPLKNSRGDDHNMGSLWLRPDGRYIHMYAVHNDKSRKSYYRISAKPHDITKWQPEKSCHWPSIGNPDQNGNITYSNLLYLSSEGSGKGRLYNIGRESQRSPNIAYSDDWGQTWKYAGKLSLTKTTSSYSNGYYKFKSNNIDRIDFIATEHHPRDYNTNIYHGYIKGGKSYNSFGKIIDSNIFDENAPAPEDFTPVFMSSPEDGVNDGNEYHRAWTTNLERDGKNLTALFTTRFGTKIADNRPGDADHRIFYARFDGRQWQTTELAKMGRGLHNKEQDYTGLGAINPNNSQMVYISTPFDPSNNNELEKHEIFKGISDGTGTKWQWTQITFNSTSDNIRPDIPIWDANNAAVFWLRGNYPRQEGYDLTMVGIIDNSREIYEKITYIDANNSNTTSTGKTSKTTISKPGKGTYDIFIFFWANADDDSRIVGGLSPAEMLVFRRKACQQAESGQFINNVSLSRGKTCLYRAYAGRKKIGQNVDINVYTNSIAEAQHGDYAGIGIRKVLFKN